MMPVLLSQIFMRIARTIRQAVSQPNSRLLILKKQLYSAHIRSSLYKEFVNQAHILHQRKLYLDATRASIGTQRKMQKDERYRIDYDNFMNTLLEMGYAVQSDECPNGKTWYIPHHGVKQPTKQKLRVVFDCSASYRNHCLNENFFKGQFSPTC